MSEILSESHSRHLTCRRESDGEGPERSGWCEDIPGRYLGVWVQCPTMTNSRTSPWISSTNESCAETTINTGNKKSMIASFPGGDRASTIITKNSKFETSNLVHSTPGSASKTSHKTLHIYTIFGEASGSDSSIRGALGTSTASTQSQTVCKISTNRVLDMPISLGEPPETNICTVEISTRAAESLKNFKEERGQGASMEKRNTQKYFVGDSRNSKNSVEVKISQKNFVEENRHLENPKRNLQGCMTIRNNLEESMTPQDSIKESSAPRDSVEYSKTTGSYVQESRTPATSGEECINPMNSVQENRTPRNNMEDRSNSLNTFVKKWTPETTSLSRRRHHGRTCPALRLILLHQRRIMRELQELRRSNEQLQGSLHQVMEEIRKHPDNPATLPAAMDFQPHKEVCTGENVSILNSELCFFPGLPLHRNQLVSGSSMSTREVQEAASKTFNESPTCAASEAPPHAEFLDFDSSTLPHHDNLPSSLAAPQSQIRNMTLDFMGTAAVHSTKSKNSLTEVSSIEVQCIPLPVLENVKEEPDIVMKHSELLAPLLPPPRAPRWETQGNSLPDIPLVSLTPEREAVLLRHSKGEPHTLAKILFQQHVPFNVYESWVHTTNFDGSRNKRAIPRNLRVEIMRFISSRFYLSEEDKKQIRDRINELLRMPRTGGWPVLN